MELVALPFSRESSQPRDRTHVSYVSFIGKRVLYHSGHLNKATYIIQRDSIQGQCCQPAWCPSRPTSASGSRTVLSEEAHWDWKKLRFSRKLPSNSLWNFSIHFQFFLVWPALHLLLALHLESSSTYTHTCTHTGVLISHVRLFGTLLPAA